MKTPALILRKLLLLAVLTSFSCKKKQVLLHYEVVNNLNYSIIVHYEMGGDKLSRPLAFGTVTIVPWQSVKF